MPPDRGPPADTDAPPDEPTCEGDGCLAAWCDDTAVIDACDEGPTFTVTELASNEFDQSAAFIDADGDGIREVVYGSKEAIWLRTNSGEVRSIHSGYTSQLAVLDANGDGRDDIAMTDGSLTIHLLLGDGEGAFAQAAEAAVAPWTLVAGDFNGDGLGDVTGRGIDGLFVWAGRSEGTFADPTRGRLYYGGSEQRLDADENEYDDLVAHDWDRDAIIVMLGRPDRPLHPYNVVTRARDTAGFAVGDVDADGQDDLVIARRDDPTDETDNDDPVRLELWLGQGAVFDHRQTCELPEAFFVGGAADYDGGGETDVLVTVADGMAILSAEHRCWRPLMQGSATSSRFDPSTGRAVAWSHEGVWLIERQA
jgi:hypothetical protein